MRLIVQPDEGIEPVLHAISRARRTLDVSIFRLDHGDVTKALKAAVARGVAVRARVAHRNSTGGKGRRKLEMRLRETGATVCPTDNDHVRYHEKIMVVDRDILYVFGFNFTHLDIDKSRSFGLIIRNRKLVQEAAKLFDADCMRKAYSPGLNTFIVSPLNARTRLAALIRKARRRLLVYDPNLGDPTMLKLLVERVKAGVDVRIIGKVARKGSDLRVAKCPGKRLHVRAIVQDSRRVFVGSQSLRKLELDKRREVGVITKDTKIIRAVADHFERDWAETQTAKKEAKAARKEAKKVEKEEKKDEKPSLVKAS
jgi:phosphatidylserine/phosphatidylglycerophosphate/cardiolipin synthase-like enzyme